MILSIMDDTESSSGTPKSTNLDFLVPNENFNDDNDDNDENIIIMNEDEHIENMEDEENDNRSVNSYGNINDEIEALKVKKVKHYKLKKFKSHLDYCKITRNVTLLKYHDLAFIISNIQISVIIVSTCITFFETIREDIGIDENTQTILSVSLSTYIALIVAISRFLKFDEKKEHFSKLSEKWNQTINMMRVMQYKVEALDSYSLSPKSMKSKIHEILIPKYREDISVVDNETDNLLNMNEKTHYKNVIMNMRLDDQILDRHDTLFYIYKRLQYVFGFKFNIDKYRSNYTPCIPKGFYVSDYDAFFYDMENVCKKSAEQVSQNNKGRKNPNDKNYAGSDDGIEYNSVADCIRDAYRSRSKYHLV
jgi:hypothetical protein